MTDPTLSLDPTAFSAEGTPLDGIPVRLTPTALSNSIQGPASLVLEQGAYDLTNGRGVLPPMASGPVVATLLGNALTVELAGPLMVTANGATGNLKSVRREDREVRFVLVDLGAETPFSGTVELFTETPDGPLYDLTVDPDTNGVATVSVRPGASYRARRLDQAQARQLEPTWEVVEDWFLAEDGATVVLGRRRWNVQLKTPVALAGREVVFTAAGRTVVSRADSRGDVYALLPQGTHSLFCSGFTLSPESIVVDAASVILPMRAVPFEGSATGPGRTLTLRLALPEGESPLGQIELQGPEGVSSTFDAVDGTVVLHGVTAGRYGARLVSHPRLDASASIVVADANADVELSLEATPGARSRWVIESNEGGEVFLLDGTPLGRRIGRVGEPIRIRPSGLLQVVIPLSAGALISPLRDSALDTELEFQTMISVAIDRLLILRYADDWIHVLAEDQRVRPDPTAAYSIENETVIRYDVELQDGAPVRLSNPRPPQEGEVPALLSQRTRSLDDPGVLIADVTGVAPGGVRERFFPLDVRVRRR